MLIKTIIFSKPGLFNDEQKNVLQVQGVLIIDTDHPNPAPVILRLSDKTEVTTNSSTPA